MKLRKYLFWQANKAPYKNWANWLANCVYGAAAFLLARPRLVSDIDESVDVLILHRSSSSKRFPALISALGDLSVIEMDIPKKKRILQKKLLSRSSCLEGLAYYLYSAYAHYIVTRYRPKLIAIDANGSSFTPFLRRAINSIGGKLVHVAHSIPTANYRQFCLLDYDYAFVYGQSSVDRLRSMPLRFGSTQCVVTGSLFIDKPVALSSLVKGDACKCVLLGSGPSYERRGDVEPTYRSLLTWAREASDAIIYFKSHPRSDKTLWLSLVREFGAESYVRDVATLDECLDASFAVAAYTNAVVDVASRGIPVVWVAGPEEVDHFSIESFFVNRVVSTDKLAIRIDEVLSGEGYYYDRALEFSRYHLGGQEYPPEYMANLIRGIIAGRADLESESLPEILPHCDC